MIVHDSRLGHGIDGLNLGSKRPVIVVEAIGEKQSQSPNISSLLFASWCARSHGFFLGEFS
jgi:hypothetical protein